MSTDAERPHVVAIDPEETDGDVIAKQIYDEAYAEGRKDARDEAYQEGYKDARKDSDADRSMALAISRVLAQVPMPEALYESEMSSATATAYDRFRKCSYERLTRIMRSDIVEH